MTALVKSWIKRSYFLWSPIAVFWVFDMLKKGSSIPKISKDI
jgi:hypothetical protein